MNWQTNSSDYWINKQTNKAEDNDEKRTEKNRQTIEIQAHVDDSRLVVWIE
jgi:hypothetical protein